VAAALATVPAAAGGSFRSTTTLHVAITRDGRDLVLTARVDGAFGRPSGPVAFLDDHDHLLGSATLPYCTSACAVVERVRVSALSAHVSEIYARYPGNPTLQSSFAGVPILYERCRKTATCDSTLSGAETSLGVAVSRGESALVTLGAARLPCSIGAGQVVNLATTGHGPNIQAALYEAGDAGAAYLDADNHTFKNGSGHSAYRCMVTNSAFTGFSPADSTDFSESSADFAHYGTSPQVGAGHYTGQYAGLIADCFQLATHAHTKTGACENLPKIAGPIPDEVLITISGGNRVSHFAG
jgi:hypothetical protein